MPATPVWLAALEAALNRSIDTSPQAAAAARRLNGTALDIEVAAWWRIRAAVAGNRLMLLAADEVPAAGETPANAVIRGSLLALAALLKGGAAEGRRPGVDIRGDAEIAGRYRELFAMARPDWEEELSRLLGDLPARRVSSLAESAVSWLRRAGRTAGENIAEYLQEESRDLVNRTELEEFLSGVDRVREAADRVEARLVRLEQRLRDSA
jgi:ubiquinone biosynthesis accessory factor UbiJ